MGKRIMRWYKIIYDFGAGPRQRVAFAWFIFLTKLKLKFPSLEVRERKLVLNLFARDCTLYLREDPDELQTPITIFYEHEYSVPAMERVRGDGGILDIGANIGLASVYFALRFPQATIDAYEPNADICGRLSKNVGSFPNVCVHNQAVSDRDGEISFFVSPRSVASSVSDRGGSFVERRVSSATLDTILERCGGAVEIVKFDVEGAEYEMFKTSTMMDRCEILIGEVHWDLISVSRVEFYRLFDRSFTRTDIDDGSKRSICAFVNKKIDDHEVPETGV